MNKPQRDWIRERATKLDSRFPPVPLSESEADAVDRIVGTSSVIAIGEMTHGSKEVLDSRNRILKFLIQERNVTNLVLEACAGATRRLDEFLVSGVGTAVGALTHTGYWSCLNRETLQFVDWLREHNASRQGRGQLVQVYGCDMQSIDGPKAEILRLLQEFGRSGELAPDDCVDVIASLDRLPTDRALYRSLDALIREASAATPDTARIAVIEARRQESMTAVRTSAARCSNQLRTLLETLGQRITKDDRFFLERCARLIEQVVDFHFPGGFALRDQFLAENVTAIKRHFVNERMALALHNLHISRVPLTIRGEPFIPMGSLLANELGTDYKAIGSAFHRGRFLAAPGTREGEDEIAVAYAPRPNAFEFVLHEFAQAQQLTDFILDLTRDRSEGAAPSPWPPALEMRIGETGSQGDYEQAFMPQSPELQYDGLIFLTESTPITVLAEHYDAAREKWGTDSRLDEDASFPGETRG